MIGLVQADGTVGRDFGDLILCALAVDCHASTDGCAGGIVEDGAEISIGTGEGDGAETAVL